MKTGSEKKTKLFALVLTHNRLWGSILLPYIIQSEPNKKYYKLAECLAPFPDNETLGTLTSEEREVIKIINEYSDRNLFKIFSKDRTVKEFTEKLTCVNLEKFIRPYIERRIYKCISISRDERIPVYFQKSKIETLHSEDLLSLVDSDAKPVFSFIRSEEQTTYNLSLEYEGKLIDMRKKSIDILCLSPCLIRDDHRV